MMLRARFSLQAVALAAFLGACGGTTLTVVDAGPSGGGGSGAAGGGSGSGGAGEGGGKSDSGVCPALACLPNCPAGVKVDASGCQTCECNPPPGPPPACNAKSCPQPAPSAPNHLCPDGKTVGGPACVALADGTCGWVFITCPPKCVQNVACVVGAHWDPDLCRCVSPCRCPAGQVCVEQIGGPAVQNPPPMTCQPYDGACYQASGSACACLPKEEGSCKPRGGGGDRACVCDNGIR